MLVAEDVATPAAVVSALKVVEGFLAGRMVADCRILIGLPVFSGGHAGRIRVEVQVPVAIGAFAIARRSPAQPQHTQPAETHETVVVAQWFVASFILIFGLRLGRWLLGRELGGPQDSWYEEWPDAALHVVLGR